MYRQKPKLKTVIFTFLTFGLLLSPWIITELRWKFVGSKSLIAYFLHQGTAATAGNPISFLISSITRYYASVSQGIYFSFIPNKPLGFAIVGVSLLYLLLKKRSSTGLFFLFWILNTLPLFAFKSGVHSTQVINGSIFVPLTILFAYVAIELAKIKFQKIPILSIVIISSIVLYGFIIFIKNGFSTYTVQIGVPSLLINSKQVIDYTYEKAQKKDFGICSISEPLFMNTVWSFLYLTYGKQKYGYLPYWTGQQQTLNESFIPYANKKYTTKFIIQEPMSGIPNWALRSVYFVEDSQNTLVEKRKFGYYEVQERNFIKENGGNISGYSENLKKSIYEDLNKVPQLSCDNVHEQK